LGESIYLVDKVEEWILVMAIGDFIREIAITNTYDLTSIGLKV